MAPPGNNQSCFACNTGDDVILRAPAHLEPHVRLRVQRFPHRPESGGRVHIVNGSGRACLPQRLHGSLPGAGLSFGGASSGLRVLFVCTSARKTRYMRLFVFVSHRGLFLAFFCLLMLNEKTCVFFFSEGDKNGWENAKNTNIDGTYRSIFFMYMM